MLLNPDLVKQTQKIIFFRKTNKDRHSYLYLNNVTVKLTHV